MQVEVSAERCPDGSWLVVTTYPHDQRDECYVIDREEAERVGRLIKQVAYLTDDEDLIGLIATQSIDPDTSRDLLRGLKIMKGMS